MEKLSDLAGGMLFAILFLSISGFLSTQFFGPVPLSLALIAVVLMYALLAALAK